MESPMRSLAALWCALLTSCATIVSPSTYPLAVSSTPPGATVRYLDADVGVTPCTIAVRHKSCKVDLRLAGYHDQQADFGQQVNGWLFGNILFGGILGVIIDLTSGAAVVPKTDPIHVDLTPDTMPTPAIWIRPKPKASSIPSGPDF